MADRNRGGRSREGDPIERDDEFETELDDVLDEDAFDVEEDETDQAPAARRTRARTAAPSRTAARTRTRDARPGIVGRIVNFIREIVAELQKVIWPTRKELLTYTTVVIVFVAIMMTFVALLDLGFARLMFIVFGSSETPAAS